MHTYHQLHCSVCQGQFTTGTGWLAHLLAEYHQVKARKEVFQWDDKMKECTLLVFPTVRDDFLTILQYFSISFVQEQDHLVTDFVCYPERPRIGFIQFESKAKVDEVMGTQGGILEAWIGNQLVEMKRATSCGKLEWWGLLPYSGSVVGTPTITAPAPSSNSNQNQTNSPQNPVSVQLVSSSTSTTTDITSTKVSPAWTPVSQCMPSPVNLNRTPPATQNRTPPATQNHAQKRSHNASSNCVSSGDTSEDVDEVPLKRRLETKKSSSGDASEDIDEVPLKRRLETKKSTTAKDDKVLKVSRETEEDNLSSDSDCGSSRLNNPMWRQYYSIRSTLAIPKQRYAEACSLSSKIEELFSTYFKKCKVFMFRNWFLKIWNQQGSVDDLLFFIIDKEYTGKRRRSLTSTPPAINSSLMTDKAFTAIFNSSRGQQLFPGVVPQPSPQLPYGYSYLHQPTNTIFSVISDPIALPEVQACRLLKYLSSFDTRVKPLLVLIRWWATVNDVHVGQNRTYTRTPDTATLDWLVIYFLCKEIGIVPSPRQVQQRTHKTLLYRNVDIGFSTDCEWAQQCSLESAQMKKKSIGEFVASVMTLTREFFTFCSHLWKQNNCILNIRDGEIIDRKEFLKGDGSPIIAINTNQQTKLSDEEIEMVKRLKSFSTQRPASKEVIKILHPLFPKATLPLTAKTFGTIVREKMSWSAHRIARMLTAYSKYNQKKPTSRFPYQLKLTLQRQVPERKQKTKAQAAIAKAKAMSKKNKRKKGKNTKKKKKTKKLQSEVLV